MITQEQKAQALQKLSLLKNSCKPSQCFFEMIQNSSQKETALIAFQNLHHTQMLSITTDLESYSLKNSNSSNVGIWIDVLRCFSKVALAQIIQVLRINKQQLQKKKKEIRNVIISIICIISPIICFICDYASDILYGTSLKECNQLQSHIHQDFLLNTMWAQYPTDIAFKQISCSFDRQTTGNETFLKLQYFIVPIQTFSAVVKAKQLLELWRKKVKLQLDINMCKRKISESSPLRIIE